MNICLPLTSNSICAPLLSPSSTLHRYEYVSNASFSSYTRLEFENSYAPSAWGAVQDPCRSLFAQYHCLKVYPPCSTSTSTSFTADPEAICNEIRNQCDPIDISFIDSVLPLPLNCSGPSSPVVFPSPAVPQCIPYPPSSPSSSSSSSSSSSTVCSTVFPQPGYSVYMTYSNYSSSSPSPELPLSKLSFDARSSLLSSFQFLFALIPRSPSSSSSSSSSSSQCALLLAEYMCSSLFPRCDVVTVPVVAIVNNASASASTSASEGGVLKGNRTMILPQRLCTNTCNEYLLSCLDFLTSLASAATSSSSSSSSSSTSSSSVSMHELILSQFLTAQCANTEALSITSMLSSLGEVGELGGSALSVPWYQPPFSNGVENFTIGEMVASVACNYFQVSSSSSSLLSVGPPVVTCPAPLLLTNDHPELTIPSNAYCALPCPFGYSQNDLENLTSMNFILTTISFVLSSFLLATWLVFPIKRSQSFVLCFIFCTFCLSLTIFASFAGAPDRTRIGCQDAVSVVQQQTALQHGDVSCPIAAAFLIYFTLAGTFWWSFIAFELYMKIVNMAASVSRRSTILFHLYGWFVPAILVSVGLSYNVFGGLGAPFLCEINVDAFWPYWVIVYAPLIVHFVATVVVIVMIIKEIHTSSSTLEQRHNESNEKHACFSCCRCRCLRIRGVDDRTQSRARSHSSHSLSLCRQHLRILLFLTQMSLCFFTIIVVSVINTQVLVGTSSPVYKSVSAWVTCLLSYGGSESTCGNLPQTVVPTWVIYMLLFSTSSQGIINFLAYGTQWSNFLLWSNLVSGRGRGANENESLQWSHERDSNNVSNAKSTSSRNGRARGQINRHTHAAEMATGARNQNQIDRALLSSPPTALRLPTSSSLSSTSSFQPSHRVLVRLPMSPSIALRAKTDPIETDEDRLEADVVTVSPLAVLAEQKIERMKSNH